MRRRMRGVKSATPLVVTRYTLGFDERADPFERERYPSSRIAFARSAPWRWASAGARGFYAGADLAAISRAASPAQFMHVDNLG